MSVASRWEVCLRLSLAVVRSRIDRLLLHGEVLLVHEHLVLSLPQHIHGRLRGISVLDLAAVDRPLFIHIHSEY